MRKLDKTLLLSLSLTLMLPISAMAKESKVTRIYGKDRYETSSKVADELSDSYEKIIVASGEMFPDALAGSVLTSGKYPIVLASKDRLDPSVRAKISKAKEVYILGGSETISSAVENDIKSLGAKVSRLSGMDRYETSVKIAQVTGSKDLILVNGDLFPDSLTASGIALLNNRSILLVKSNEMPQSVKDYIKKINPSSITIIGGSKSVDDRLEKESKLFTNNVKRISGRDRYETSLEVAKQFTNLKNLVVVSGDNFTDALSASSIAGKLKAPMLLVDGKISSETVAYIEKNKKNIDSIKVVGGPNMVSDSTFKSISNVVETKDSKKEEDKKVLGTVIKPNKDKPSSEKPNQDKPNQDNPKLADKPADGIWYGTAFEGYGPESYGASIVKVEIEGGKIKSAEAIKHCATDASYINLAKKLLPLYKGKTVPDLDSIYQELSDKLSSGKKGSHTDAVTSATMTSKGYALAIKNAVERARKFAFDKKEQKIAYIKITGDNISSPGIDRTAVAEKSKLTNGKNADFDFVKYDIMMSNGTLEKEVKFSDLKKYGIEANYKQGETLNSDGKDNIILTVEDETGYASEKIRLHVNPKDERVEVRPTHALITFENSTDTPDTERIDIEKGKIVYDTKKTYNKKIKKVELFRDNKLIKEGEFKPVFNYWWFEIEDKDYNLGDKEKWEFRRYRIVTRINGDLKPGESSKPDTPEKPKPSIVKNGYVPKTIRIIDKNSKKLLKQFDFEKEDWKDSSIKKKWDDISQEIITAKDINKTIDVEALNASNEKLDIKSIIKLISERSKTGILEIIIDNPTGEESTENHLIIPIKLSDKLSASNVEHGYVPAKVVIKNLSDKTLKEFSFEKSRWDYSSTKENWSEIPQDIVKADDINKKIKIEAFNEKGESLNIQRVTKSIMERTKTGILTILIDNPDGEESTTNQLVIPIKLTN